jgi:hypothetical protein
MAEQKTLVIKKYPEEAKEKLKKLLEETSVAREALDKLDEALQQTNSPCADDLKKWAREATGWGNYLRKKLLRLEAAAINEKGARYLEIKLECNLAGTAFADNAAKAESEAYIAPLRTVRSIFESYVKGAEATTSTCRMHFYGDQTERNNSVEM